MFRSKTAFIIKHVLLAILAGLIIAGCGAVGFSPESVAANSVLNNPGNLKVDPKSVQVLQTLNVDGSRAIVLVLFQGVREGVGQQTCLFSQGVEKWQLGWRSSNGGGGCMSNTGSEPVEDIWVGSGISTSGNFDPGLSEVHGMVNKPEITRVRITWIDDQVDEVDVIQSSFVTSRIGQVQMKSVQGLDAQGQVIFDQNPQVAPGKK